MLIALFILLGSANSSFAQTPSNGVLQSCIHEQPVSKERIRVSHRVLQGSAISSPDIELGDDIKKALKSAKTLRILVSINTTGEISCYRFESSEPVSLDAAGTVELKTKFDAGMSQWKYRPYLLNGQPIAIESSVPLEWKKTKLRIAKD
jgi:hypothetical protein